MKIESLGGIPISMRSPLLILEAGVNHEGSIDRAFEMIDAAADAGADCIKFQSYKAETLASRNSPSYWDRTKEPASNQYDLFKKHDSFGDAEYAQLAQRCEQKGVLFCSTPFDAHFVDLLDAMMPFYKIASADITNDPLLTHVASKGKPVLLSTGAATLEEADAAVELLESKGAAGVGILHCVLEYPTPPEHANLRVIEALAERFPGRTIGWSDHVAPDEGPQCMIAAWLLGATVLEKHYTLDKALPGNDHYHAFDPDDVRAFRQQQRTISTMLGDRDKRVMDWERDSRKYARRSLVATRDLPAGTVLDASMCVPKRPGTGVSPRYLDLVIGHPLANDVREDDVLDWDHFPDVERPAD